MGFNREMLEGIGRSLSTFFTLSTVKGLNLTMLPPEGSLRGSVLARKRCSWMKEGDDKVNMYVPNIGSGALDYWQGHVLRAALADRGLAGLFPGGAAALLDGLNAVLGDSGVRLGSLELWDSFLAGRSAEKTGPAFWKAVSDAVCVPIGLLRSDLVMRCIRDAYKDRDRARDHALTAGAETLAAEATVKRPQRMPLDGAGDVMRSLGYPDVRFDVVREKLLHLLLSNGLSVTEGQVSKGFGDPLMVVRSSKSWNDGTVPTVVVTDLSVQRGNEGKQYLAFSVAPPGRVAEETADAALSGRDVLPVSAVPFFISDAKLSHTLAEEENWMYMRKSGVGYDYIENLKKNVAASSPVLNASGLRRRSLAIANIAEKFENPSVSPENVLPAPGISPVMEEVSARAEKTAAGQPDVPDREKPVPDEKVPSLAPESPRESFLIPKGVVDDPVRDRLFKAGITTAMAVARAGFDRVREVAGQDRAVNSIADWMAGNGIFVFSRDSLLVPQMKPSEETVLSHFHDCILRSGESVPKEVALPAMLDGTLFTGADAVHVMLSDTGRKASECPYWVTEAELLNIGCRPGKALPVPVQCDGDPRLVYNLAETDFPKRYPGHYSSLVEVAGRETREERQAGRYFSIIAGSLGAVKRGRMNCISAWMDGSTSANFERLHAIRRCSLRNVVGEAAMQEMFRKGKVLKMYETVKLANRRVKSKHV